MDIGSDVKRCVVVEKMRLKKIWRQGGEKQRKIHIGNLGLGLGVESVCYGVHIHRLADIPLGVLSLTQNV
jgi:hypothetical protein